ncbi:hypothetical protein [Paraburkholderia terrae]
MTGDIVRFCRTGNEAVQATAFGFLLANLPFLIIGVLVGASGIRVNDLFTAGNALSWLLLVLVIVSVELGEPRAYRSDEPNSCRQRADAVRDRRP